MSARDELAKLLFVADNHNAKDADAEWEFLQQTPKYLAAYHQMAGAILAAGYRRPRIITTAEERDALPDGSVVLAEGVAYQHYASQVDLPATVLHEPEQP